MTVFLLPLIVLAGVLQAMGNSMNAQLNQSLGNPYLASFVSFFLITIVFVGVFCILPKPLPTAAAIEQMPWWAPVGGLAGAVAVFLGLMFVSQVGAGAFNGLLITANVAASVMIDHWGLLRMPVHALTPGRCIGVVLMAVGIALVSKF